MTDTHLTPLSTAVLTSGRSTVFISRGPGGVLSVAMAIGEWYASGTARSLAEIGHFIDRTVRTAVTDYLGDIAEPSRPSYELAQSAADTFGVARNNASAMAQLEALATAAWTRSVGQSAVVIEGRP